MSEGRRTGRAGPPRGARDVAVRALVRVWEAGAFAAAALDVEVSRAGLDARDAALATELVYGVLRTEGALGARLLEAAKRPSLELAPEVRGALYVGAYSLRHLTRVPAFAAVSEAVSAARRAGGDGVAKLVNALLRRVAEAAARERPSFDDDVLASTPAWLRERLLEELGEEATRKLLSARAEGPPPLGLYVPPAEGATGSTRDQVLRRARELRPDGEVELSALSPRGLSLRGVGDPDALVAALATPVLVQEEGAQLVGLSLGARPGERVLDACAGRGNKTFLLAHEVGPAGAVLATDVAIKKLERAKRLPNVEVRAVDWSSEGALAALGLEQGCFDRALIDAPCTGTGTLRRRPEIARHREPGDPERLAALGVAIVRNVAALVRPDGRLVYAVCSVLGAECEKVVEAVLSLGLSLELAPFDSDALRALAGEAPTLRLMPHEHGTDGYFLASFVKRA